MEDKVINKKILIRKIKFKVWYEANKESVNKRTLEYQRRKQKEFEEWKLTQKCSNCDENHPACLDFHHIDPSKKHKGITWLRASPNKLKEELKKCTILCSNCHKKLHWNEKQKLKKLKNESV